MIGAHQSMRSCRAAWQTVTLTGLAALVFLCGCIPASQSLYIPMDDGTELAADLWMPRNLPTDGHVPAVLRLGRYWRDYQLAEALPQGIGTYPFSVGWLNTAGYAVLVVDVRGTGASFGTSIAPWSPEETGDFPQLVDWVIQQPWSNGKVGAVGVSYEGVAADWLGAKRHPAVKAVLPAYTYSDVYLNVSHPGGIFNQRFVKAWGDLTSLMDQDSTAFLDIIAAANPQGLLALVADMASAALLGVRPITGAGALLQDAVAQHAANPNVFDAAKGIEFRDDPFGPVTTDIISPLLGAESLQRSAAIRRVVGWPDAGTARGALTAFNTLNAAYHVVVIAPETHTGNYRADPYVFSDPPSLDRQQVIRDIWGAVPFLDSFLKGDSAGTPLHQVVYYTYVERTWKQTPVWPPTGFEMQRWYFGAGGGLGRTAPTEPAGADDYTVDFDATTGLYNRWFSGLSGVPIRYLDRAAQDTRLLVYESAPLDHAVELTGHPIVSLQVASTATDGSFFVYLEDVAPSGKVVYVTEGELRAVHRRVSADPPRTAVFGPYHTFKRSDAQPLVPGEVAVIAFDLQPISTIFRAGHQIRVALAGHDSDTFVRYPPDEIPVLSVQRNAANTSWIDLPLKLRSDLDTIPDDDPPVGSPLVAALCPTTSLALVLLPLLLSRQTMRIRSVRPGFGPRAGMRGSSS